MTSAAPAPLRGTRSLHRALQLLRLLSMRTRTGWRLSDLAEEAGLDHSTVHRILAAMVQERLAARLPGSTRYALGGFAYELGLAAAPWYALDAQAAPLLSRLAAELRAIVFLNLRSGTDTVCVARHEGRTALKAYTVEVGVRRPLAVSAGGVAILAALPRAQRATVMQANLHAIAHSEPARQAAVRRMVRRSWRLGYGLNLEDIIPGIAAVGVAVRAASGEPVASISAAAPAAGFTDARRTTMLGRLHRAAAEIEPMLQGLRL